MRSDIRLASLRDIPDLCDLWVSCFPDPGEYVRYFYRENFRRMCVPVYTLNEKPVSMIHMMDASFASGNDEYPVKFIYAVGTLPEYRGKGFMQSLILSACNSAKENGYGLFLKPSPDLMDFYSALGFAEDGHFRIFSAEPGPDGHKDISCAALSAEEYNHLRNSAFSVRPFVKWPDDHIRWCVDENTFCGGQTLSITFDKKTHFLMGCPVNGVLRITETDLDPEQLKNAAFSLCRMFGVSHIEAYLPEEVFREGPSVVSSGVFNAPLKKTYANLLLF